MDLPLRILDRAPTEPVISVDGAWNAPGLNLSHWPGNTTPAELRHDLSTGAALAFARLPEARRRELALGCTAIANNHVDTDGLCAMFVVRHPELALPHADALLAAARAGDFFEPTGDDALVLDALLTALVDGERSPWREAWTDLDGRARHEDACRRVVELLPNLLAGDVEPWRELWAPALERWHRDRAGLAAAQRDDLVHLDLVIWTAPPGGEPFRPGRHALFGEARRDRILVVDPGPEGATFRFLLGTRSWFDLATAERLPRPDLDGLAARLSALEPSAAHAWHAQPATGASPELWYGTPGLPAFPEVNEHLRPSRLEPELVRRELIEALRACFAFPEE